MYGNYRTKGIVISLYDFTGEALRPWAEEGYECYAYDIQQKGKMEVFASGGVIFYLHADLHDVSTHQDLYFQFNLQNMCFAMAFPVCTDLAVSGAAHFAKKAEADPFFQQRAAQHATDCAGLFDDLGCPYFVENPVSVLSTLWRKPDHTFHPYEYGGYIAKDDAQHPLWPEYIADCDAYPKKTCLWTGNGFVMPTKLPVEPKKGYSKQHLKLGGKSTKTKNIRSATPRGFARAVMQANAVASNTKKDAMSI